MAFASRTEQVGAENTSEEPSSELGGLDPKELVQASAEFARENPHVALATAFSIGFLLGGGLTPRLLASIAAFVGRRYLAQVASETLEGAVGRHVDEALKGAAP